MRWEVKAAIQATLSRVPMGYALHRKLQDLAGSSRLEIDVQYPRKRQFLQRARDRGLPLEGRAFLEIGTGWHPLLPLLLSLLGAGRVVTIDVNPWLTRSSLEETLGAVRAVAERVEADFGVPAARCRELADALAARAAKETPAAALRAARVEYARPVDARKTPFGDGEFDYVVSSNVLEHVPPEVIRAMVRESRRLLKPGGLNLHHVNPGDHFSFDPRITSVNFLRYSPRAWHFIGGSGLAYHNRLRCVDYARLFEEAGFEVVYREAEVDPAALAALAEGRVRPHAAFDGYSAEELSEHVIDVFARRGSG
jgi:SAM-dependent methyltransferase